MILRGLLGFIAIWGIADSIWLAFFPQSWASWWGRFIARMGQGGAPPRLVALWEFALSAALLFAASRDSLQLRTRSTPGSVGFPEAER
jgi:hypothetical protein